MPSFWKREKRNVRTPASFLFPSIWYKFSMDVKSKYLFSGFMLLVVVISYWGYRVFFVERNFMVQSTTTCDPQAESCFVWCEDGKCEEDYYKKIMKRAYNIPVCNEALEECEPLVCETDEIGCEIMYCSGDTLQDNEKCTNPRDFQIENIEPTATSTEPIP